jgi:hypothetical protein
MYDMLSQIMFRVLVNTVNSQYNEFQRTEQKVRYIEIRYTKSLNQKTLFKRYLKENLDFIRFL